MKRNGSAVWKGDLKNGQGEVSAESGVLSGAQYSFGTRFENGTGTNPEELLGAAHAGCYSMALSLVLGEAGITPERIETQANVTVEPTDDGFTITAVHLDVEGVVPGISAEDFQAAADKAKDGCPVSKLFNADITLSATLSA